MHFYDNSPGHKNTYSANSQFQLIPSTNGTVTLTILTEGITAYGIGFKLTE